MSAVKSETRSTLFQNQLPGQAQAYSNGLNHARSANQFHGSMPQMQQNFRRNLGACASSSGFGAQASSKMAWHPSNGNFAFIQSASTDASGPLSLENAAQASMKAAEQSHQAMSMGISGSTRTAQSETYMIKFLKQFSSEYSDDKLREVLIRSSWDTQKAIDLVCDLTYEENKSANQKKLNETRSIFSQCVANAGAETSRTQSFTSQYQVSRPTKRRRAQFDGQQNQVMHSENQSPSNSNQILSQHQPVQLSNAGLSSEPQQVAPVAQEPSVDQNWLRNYKVNLASLLVPTIAARQENGSKQSVAEEALEHFAQVANQQQAKVLEAKKQEVSEQLTTAQRNLNRVEHDNRILRKGFNAVLKKQSEWCKDSTENESLRRAISQLQQENKRLQTSLMMEKKLNYQPAQSAAIASQMFRQHNDHDDVM